MLLCKDSLIKHKQFKKFIKEKVGFLKIKLK